MSNSNNSNNFNNQDHRVSFQRGAKALQGLIVTTNAALCVLGYFGLQLPGHVSNDATHGICVIESTGVNAQADVVAVGNSNCPAT